MWELTGLFELIVAQADAGAVEAADAASDPTRVESVWDFILKGGYMMIPIGICSMVAVTVLAERMISLRRRHVIPPSFVQGMSSQLKQHPHDVPGALAFCRKHDSPIARVFSAGLKRLGQPLEVLERNVQEAGQREILKLRKRLRVLSIIATVTPLLGLLGTILGMITAFQTVATSADALGKTEQLAEGIYEAMITTAAGLTVAIPALIFYHWLSGRVQKLVMDVDETTVEFFESEPMRALMTPSVHATQRGNHVPAPDPTIPAIPPIPPTPANASASSRTGSTADHN